MSIYHASDICVVVFTKQGTKRGIIVTFSITELNFTQRCWSRSFNAKKCDGRLKGISER